MASYASTMNGCWYLTMAEELVRMAVKEIVDTWRPYNWATWEETRIYFNANESDLMRRLAARVLNEGIGFADDYAPIELGPDGKVWDGHHRLVIAKERGILYVNAFVVPAAPASR